MKLIDQKTKTEAVSTYVLNHEGLEYSYIERRDSNSGELLDVILRDAYGYDVDDPILLESVQDYVATH